MTLYVRKHVEEAGIEKSILGEVVEKAVVLVEGEAVNKKIVSLDNYYYWAGEKTVEDYLAELIPVSLGGAKRIYALIIGENTSSA